MTLDQITMLRNLIARDHLLRPGHNDSRFLLYLAGIPDADAHVLGPGEASRLQALYVEEIQNPAEAAPEVDRRKTHSYHLPQPVYIAVGKVLPHPGDQVLTRHADGTTDRLCTFWRDYRNTPHFGRKHEAATHSPVTHWKSAHG